MGVYRGLGLAKPTAERERVLHGIAGRICLGPEGLALRTLRRGRVFLRWDELRALHRRSGDLFEHLVLVTDRGRLSLPVGLSARRVARLQASILGYHERLLRDRRRRELGVDEIRRQRLDWPIRVAKLGRRSPVPAVAVVLVALGLLFVAGQLLPAVALVAAAAAWGRRRERWKVLLLGPEGIEHGATDSDLDLVPWDDVLSAHRVLTSHESTRAVRLLLRDGRHVDLVGPYDRPLEELCDLLDPPLEKAALVRDHMLAGLPLAEAAERAGLPSGRPGFA